MKTIYLVLLVFYSNCVFALGTADWMRELYSNQPNKLLVDVKIPGTHNSGTHSMRYWAPLEPGQPLAFNVIKPIVRGWSRTQFKTISQQLNEGIRYLDLRVAFDESDVPQVVHGLTALSLKETVSEILSFVISHPSEVILLHAVLAYGYGASLDPQTKAGKTQQMMNEITNQLGARIHPFSHGVRFSDFWDSGHSVMLMDDYDIFWPNAYDLERVKSSLEGSIKFSDPTRFADIQLIFTPPSSDVGIFLDPRYSIFTGPGENSLSAFSKKLTKAIPGIIQEWVHKGYRMNLISTDFYNKTTFVQDVLNLNQAVNPE